MYLTRLECRDFRRLESLAFRPVPGLNVIHGGNAQGKTTVLEAVLYAATSKSHRTATERDLLRHGAEGFHVVAEAARSDRSVTLEAHWWQGAKRFKVNGVAQPRVSDILGRLAVVFFSPEDIELVKGGAGARRRFVDMELAQIDPHYLTALQQYRQVLRQRNELLRAHKVDEDLLAVWDAQLVQHGEAVHTARAGYIDELSRHAQAAYATIAAGEPLSLRYLPDAPAGHFGETLTKARASDIKRKLTQRGPHRDDIAIRIADQPARAYGSQGQQKSAALAIKLAELALVHARIAEYPVLMLDEVLAELDADRRHALFAAIPEAVQCLVTTTDAQTAAHESGRDAAHFRIESGKLGDA